MTVWVVGSHRGHGESYTVHGVFSTVLLAREFAERNGPVNWTQRGNRYFGGVDEERLGYYPDITPFEVDAK